MSKASKRPLPDDNSDDSASDTEEVCKGLIIRPRVNGISSL